VNSSPTQKPRARKRVAPYLDTPSRYEGKAGRDEEYRSFLGTDGGEAYSKRVLLAGPREPDYKLRQHLTPVTVLILRIRTVNVRFSE